MTNRKPLYYDPQGDGFEQIDIQKDSIAASGFVFRDTASFITLDESGNMVFKDDNAGTLRLDQLAEQGVRFYKEEKILNSDEIFSGKIVLNRSPDNPSNVRLVPKFGIEQDYGDDFVVVGNELIFKNLGLDGFLEENEAVYIYYTALPD